MDPTDIASMLSSFRLGEENGGGTTGGGRGGEEEEDDADVDLSALKKAEADYKSHVGYISQFLIGAIKASNGNMSHCKRQVVAPFASASFS